MKNILNISFLLALVFFAASCSSDSSTPAANPLDEKAALIGGTSSLAEGGATTPSGATVLDWSSLVVEISGNGSGGSITATGVPQGGEPVWPASSTWTFSNEAGTKMLRADGVEMTINAASESALSLSFSVAQPAAKASIVEGSWTFEFDK